MGLISLCKHTLSPSTAQTLNKDWNCKQTNLNFSKIIWQVSTSKKRLWNPYEGSTSTLLPIFRKFNILSFLDDVYLETCAFGPFLFSPSSTQCPLTSRSHWKVLIFWSICSHSSNCWVISIYQERLGKSCLLSSSLSLTLEMIYNVTTMFVQRTGLHLHNISLLLSNSFFYCSLLLSASVSPWKKSCLSPNYYLPCLSVTPRVSKLDVYCYPAFSWYLIEDAGKGLKSIQRNKLLLRKCYWDDRAESLLGWPAGHENRRHSNDLHDITPLTPHGCIHCWAGQDFGASWDVNCKHIYWASGILQIQQMNS